MGSPKILAARPYLGALPSSFGLVLISCAEGHSQLECLARTLEGTPAESLANAIYRDDHALRGIPEIHPASYPVMVRAIEMLTGRRAVDRNDIARTLACMITLRPGYRGVAAMSVAVLAGAVWVSLPCTALAPYGLSEPWVEESVRYCHTHGLTAWLSAVQAGVLPVA